MKKPILLCALLLAIICAKPDYQFKIIGGGTRYSSILDGQNNLFWAGAKLTGNTLKRNSAAVFGSGITSVCDGGFHTNFLIACNTPSGYLGSYFIGTIFSSLTTPPPTCAVSLCIKI